MKSCGLAVEGKRAEEMRRLLAEKNLLDKKLKAAHEDCRVIFPLNARPDAESMREIETLAGGFRLVKRDFEGLAEKHGSLKEELEKKLSEKELGQLRSSFDSVGDIAIIEIPSELEAREKLIGETLLKLNRNFRVACRKTGAHRGIYRIEPVKVIAGERRTIANYRESGCIMKVPLGKVYFSPRLGSERLRIAKQIKKGEVVAALFAGVGPYPIVLAKNSRMEKAYAVELNPAAVKYMRKNIELNRLQGRITAIQGNVKKVAPKMLNGLCDRVVMPLPKGGENFLEEAIICAKPSGATIHFYQFADITKPFEAPLQLVREACRKAGVKCRILEKRKVRSYSPETIQVVIDFRARKAQPS